MFASTPQIIELVTMILKFMSYDIDFYYYVRGQSKVTMVQTEYWDPVRGPMLTKMQSEEEFLAVTKIILVVRDLQQLVREHIQLEHASLLMRMQCPFKVLPFQRKALTSELEELYASSNGGSVVDAVHLLVSDLSSGLRIA